jgi:hypothetical protein
MITLSTATPNERVDFTAPEALVKKAVSVAAASDISLNDFLHQALAAYVSKNEKQKLNSEIAEACRIYFEIDRTALRR